MHREELQEGARRCLAMLRRQVGKKLKRERDSSRSELYDKDLMSVESASTNVDHRSTNACPLSIERYTQRYICACVL